MITFKIKKHRKNNTNDYYYICMIGYGYEYMFDNIIAERLDIELEEYRNHILKISKAHKGYLNEIYFDKAEDTKPVLEWLESLVIAKKLRGTNNE
jgi:hypothetical protein